MSQIPGLLILLALTIVFAPPSAGVETLGTATSSIDLHALVRKIETQYQGSSSHGFMRMTIRTRHWTRTLTMECWSEGRDKFLARITDPAKERGTGTLKVDDNIWNYLPKIDRLMKIPSSLMGDSWMGSHLTNDDLVKENKIDELYSLSEASRTADLLVIQGVPKPDAAVVWGKILYTIDLARDIPQRIEYFDEDMALVRVLSFDEVRETQGRWLPMRFAVQPVDRPEEKTVMTYDRMTFDVPLPADLFSIRSLRKR
jgi:hypothetical protein